MSLSSIKNFLKLATGNNRVGTIQVTGGTRAAAAGLGASATAYGNLRVTAEPTSLFVDTFETNLLDTTDKWNTTLGSGYALAVNSGYAGLVSNTTNSSSFTLDTRPTFGMTGINLLGLGFIIKLEAQSSNLFALNRHAFWGQGNRPTSFTAATPLRDGFGFEVGLDGVLGCSVYSNGVRVFRATTDMITGATLNSMVSTVGDFSRFSIAYRTDLIAFYISSTDCPVAIYAVGGYNPATWSQTNFILPQLQTLPIRIALVNNSTGTVGANNFELTGVGVGDTGGNGAVISDGTHSWRRASVKAGGTPPTATDPALVVRAAPQRQWRCGFDKLFANSVDTDFMTLVQTGAGMTVNQSAGSLVITSGTTTFSETIIRSALAFNSPLKFRYGATLSQRIVNQDFYVELVDVIGDGLVCTHNSATSVTVTIPNNPFTSANVGQGMFIGAMSVASSLGQRVVIASVSGNNVTFTGATLAAAGTGTCSLFGWNYHHILYNGTTATSTLYGTQRNGWTAGDGAATINTTASGHSGVLTSDGGKSGYFDQVFTSATGIEMTQRASSIRNIPDETVNLRVQIRVRNGNVAPASTTSFTIGFLQVDQYIPQQISMVSSEPQTANSVTPVVLGAGAAAIGSITGTVSVTGYPAAAASADALANPTVTKLDATNLNFNSVTWDRQRNNHNVLTGDTGARTVTVAGATQTNYNAKGAYIYVNVGAVTGTTPTMSCQLQISLDGGTTWINFGPASTALTTASTNILFAVYPTRLSQTPGATPTDLTTGATVNVFINGVLPRTWRIMYTVGGTTPSFTLTNVQVGYLN